MSDYEWWQEPQGAWFFRNQRVPVQPTLHEQENSRTVIYDASGQPYARPKQPLGFDLTTKDRP